MNTATQDTSVPYHFAQLAYASGEQAADKDIARKVRVYETGCVAQDAYQDALAHEMAQEGQTGRIAFELAFAEGYNHAFSEREQMVYAPSYLGAYVIRACFHCRARFCKITGSPEGREHRDAAIIICVACIERLGEVVA